jgi:hypothetical protein
MVVVVAEVIAVIVTEIAASGAVFIFVRTWHVSDVVADIIVVVKHLHHDIEVFEIVVGTYGGRRERETRQYQHSEKYV